jgi:hypothetical protein
LHVEEEHHLREREGDHREVDALAPDREEAGDEPERRGRGGTGDDRELRREAPDLRRVRADVARRPEEHRVAEGEQAAEPDQQVEGAREEREAHHLHQEHRVDDERRDDEDRRHHNEADPLPARFRRCDGCRDQVFARRCHVRHYFGVPNRPAGRNISTTAMMMKITVFDASG